MPRRRKENRGCQPSDCVHERLAAFCGLSSGACGDHPHARVEDVLLNRGGYFAAARRFVASRDMITRNFPSATENIIGTRSSVREEKRAAAAARPSKLSTMNGASGDGT